MDAPNLLKIGERVQLSDSKNRKYTVMLASDEVFYTHHGAIAHNDLINKPEGSIVYSNKGAGYIVFRPLLTDYLMAMPRGAQVIYPKDIAQIILEGDIYPGLKVLEAGAGSGALTCGLLRAVGINGRVVSYEIRSDHAKYTIKNVRNYFGDLPNNWVLTIGDVAAVNEKNFDRVILDMLSPWDTLDAIAQILKPGGVLLIYVTTTPQLSKTIECIREQQTWFEPFVWETFLRPWHVVDLAVRPEHRMHAHTGFLLKTRKLAVGTIPFKPTRHNYK